MSSITGPDGQPIIGDEQVQSQQIANEIAKMALAMFEHSEGAMANLIAHAIHKDPQEDEEKLYLHGFGHRNLAGRAYVMTGVMLLLLAAKDGDAFDRAMSSATELGAAFHKDFEGDRDDIVRAMVPDIIEYLKKVDSQRKGGSGPIVIPN